MDEVVKKVAALGLPGVILVITMATTGLTGAAAITCRFSLPGWACGNARWNSCFRADRFDY